jgi:hypothetical protein
MSHPISSRYACVQERKRIKTRRFPIPPAHQHPDKRSDYKRRSKHVKPLYGGA